MSKQKTHFEQVPIQVAKKVAALAAAKGATVPSRTPYVTA